MPETNKPAVPAATQNLVLNPEQQKDLNTKIIIGAVVCLLLGLGIGYLVWGHK